MLIGARVDIDDKEPNTKNTANVFEKLGGRDFIWTIQQLLVYFVPEMYC